MPRDPAIFVYLLEHVEYLHPDVRVEDKCTDFLGTVGKNVIASKIQYQGNGYLVDRLCDDCLPHSDGD